MASPNRASQFSKVHKVLKRHYKPVSPDCERPVLEQLLFACCVENAHYNAAEEAFASLVHNYFDFNEIRVSSVQELGEVLHGLPDPPAAANRVKRVLQSVFEATYDFTLEDLRKMNLGPASDKLTEFDGSSRFAVAYVVQASLGGHAIPIDYGALRALYAVSLVSEADVKGGVVPGLERAVAKSKGLEFGSLLHQLGADFVTNPYSPVLRATLSEIDPEAPSRLPKRRGKRPAESLVERRHRRKRVADKRARAEARKQRLAEAEKAKTRQPGGRKKKSAEGEKAAAKKAPAADKKKPAATKKKPGTKKKSSAAKTQDEGGKKGLGATKISKRKPR